MLTFIEVLKGGCAGQFYTLLPVCGIFRVVMDKLLPVLWHDA